MRILGQLLSGRKGSVTGRRPVITRDEIAGLWKGLLQDAATTLIPLGPAPFAPLYGMLTDRFHVTWIIGVEPTGQK